MSSEDSFISEVSEEVRKEKLFGYIRRYGWIAVLLIVAIVGGAAWNEWRKAQVRADAEARGDAILGALEAATPAERAVALEGIEGEGRAEALLSMLAAAQADDEATRAAARDRLEAVASDAALDPVYRDLATLKVVSLQGSDMAPADRIQRLAPLTLAGAPYRALALEATALAHIAAGETQEALKILTDLVSDSDSTQGLRQRATQLIVALGGDIEAG